MQAFYQPGVGAVAGSPAGTPGVVAAPFYGAPANGAAPSGAAATPYTAMWPTGQVLRALRRHLWRVLVCL